MYYSSETNQNGFMSPSVKEYDTHMVMTNVIRPRKQKFINIDSRFFQKWDDQVNTNTNNSISSNLNTNSGFSIQLSDKLVDVTSIEIVQLELPISFYTISQALGNNNFTITNVDSKKSFSIIIPDNHYNSDNNSRTLLLQTLNSYKPDTGCEFSLDSSNRGFMIITNTSNSAIVIQFNNKSTSGTSLGWMLGFRYKSYTVKPSTALQAPAIIDWNPIRYVYLCVEDYSTTSNRDFIAYLPHSIIGNRIATRISLGDISSSYGSVVSCNSYNYLISNIRIYANVCNLSKLSCQLITEDGTNLDINGLSFSFVIKVEHEI
jgi:hypothetical protein